MTNITDLPNVSNQIAEILISPPVTIRAAMKTVNRYFRLPEELNERLTEFCARTRRDEPTTVRHILEMFFADGPASAEGRLTSGLWNAAEPAKYSHEDRRWAEEILRRASEIEKQRRPARKSG
jgi:hypothetical protein